MREKEYEIIERKDLDRKVAKDSRYINIDLLIDSEGNKFLETWKEIKIVKSDNDRFYEVKKGEEYRLDLLAEKYYRNHRLWWVIALANNIKNPLNISVGSILRIPALSAIHGYKGVLS